MDGGDSGHIEIVHTAQKPGDISAGPIMLEAGRSCPLSSQPLRRLTCRACRTFGPIFDGFLGFFHAVVGGDGSVGARAMLLMRYSFPARSAVHFRLKRLEFAMPQSFGLLFGLARALSSVLRAEAVDGRQPEDGFLQASLGEECKILGDAMPPILKMP
ncbi:MAG: hypothetical protein EBS01_03115 [Verrucomicrobia bacterium]|nr:hypothetical protein [Verrucomicrobiota bacterium]